MGAYPKPEDIRRPTPVEDTLRRVIDTIPCLVLRSRPDGYVDFVNRRLLEFTGLKLETALGWGWRTVIHPEDVERELSKRRAALASGNPFESQARLRRADGEYRWFLMREVPLRDEKGDINKWYGTCHDVEDLKEATERLRQSEAELRQIIDAIPSHVFILEPEPDFPAGRILPNRQDLEYTGRTLEEAGEHRIKVLHPDDRERLERLRERALAEGIPFEAEARVRRRDGQYRWFLIRVSPLKDENGRILRWYGTRTDIDDQKRAEDHLRLVIDTIPQQIWSAVGESSPDFSLDFCNAQWRSYTGLTLEELQGEGWQRILHPDDRQRILKAWSESAATGKPFEQEVRRRGADGKYRWFLGRAVPLKDSDGRILRWYGTNTDIEDRKEAELALRQSEHRWRAIFENASVGVTLLDASLHYVTANGAFEHMLGYASDELRSRTCVELTVAEDQLRYKAFIDELLQCKRDHFEVEKRFRRKDGSQVWTYTTASAVEGTHGKSRLWVAIVENITERKRLRDQLEQERDRMRLLLDLSNTFVSKLSLSDFFEALAESLREIEGWEYSFVALPESAASLKLHLVGGSTGELKAGTIVPIEGTFAGDAYRSGQSNFFRVADLHPVPDYAELTSWREFARAQGLQAGCNLPLQYDGKVLGVLGFHTRNDMERARADLEFLQELAKLVALALHNALRYGELSESHDALRESEDRLRLVIDTIPQQIMSGPGDGSLDFANAQWRSYTGLTQEELKGEGWQRIVHPDDRERLLKAVQESKATGKPYEQEVRRRGADGQYRWFLARGVPLKDSEGRIVRWYGSNTDIEDRKQAENRLRLVVDATPAMLYSARPDGYLDFFNKRWLDYLGRSLDDLSGWGWTSAIHPDDLEDLVDKWRTALATGQPYETQARVRRADGEYRWMLLRKVPLRDEAGNIVKWYGSGIDIEEQIQARESLLRTFHEIQVLKDQLYKENLVLKEEVGQASMFEEIIGSSPALRRVLLLVEKVAPTDSTVLITGETGSGKELIARAIHQRSNRKTQPFISVNCAAIPPTLVASELFGSEKGAFTGAIQRRLGRFELADGGTIFLDEIGDLPPETQIALLRVLQERTFERVGGSQPITVDVRVLAATNRDLQAAVAAGRFRQDLFYRLNVFPIHVPPLRDRVEDIPLLVEYFVKQYAKKTGKKIRNIKRKTLELLQTYDWPGNIRELQNVIERAVILSDRDTLSVDDTWLQHQSPAPTVVRGLGRLDEKREKEMIESALTQTRGRVAGPTGAAAKLGIPRSTLESKIRSLRIDKKRFNSR